MGAEPALSPDAQSALETAGQLFLGLRLNGDASAVRRRLDRKQLEAEVQRDAVRKHSVATVEENGENHGGFGVGINALGDFGDFGVKIVWEREGIERERYREWTNRCRAW